MTVQAATPTPNAVRTGRPGAAHRAGEQAEQRRPTGPSAAVSAIQARTPNRQIQYIVAP